MGANHATPDHGDQAAEGPPAQVEAEAETLLGWAEFHDGVSSLPDDEAEVFGLLWYHELTQEEAADVLGVSLSTLKRRWQSARIRLMEHFDGEPPV